jgi:hypothetical protein
MRNTLVHGERFCLQGPVKVRQLKQSKESLSWYWLFLKNLANLGS